MTITAKPVLKMLCGEPGCDDPSHGQLVGGGWVNPEPPAATCITVHWDSLCGCYVGRPHYCGPGYCRECESVPEDVEADGGTVA